MPTSIIKSNTQLPFYHPWYDVTDDEGNLKDRIPKDRPRTVRDADDYSHYVAEGPNRPDMMANSRWEKRWGGQPLRYVGGNGNNMSLHLSYVTHSYVSNSTFGVSLLLDPMLESCSLSNCHIHFTVGNDISSCVFRDCVITTSSDAGLVYVDNSLITNCTLKGHFAEAVGRSDCQRVAKNPILTEMAPFEVHNNIVFKDITIRTLRRYIHRFRQRQALLRKYKKSGFYYHSNNSLRDSVMSDAGQDLPPQPPRSAEKRPAVINNRYDAGEQLELPLRRCEWSVEKAKKRRIDLTGMDVDN
jgi:hypothetical protein